MHVLRLEKEQFNMKDRTRLVPKVRKEQILNATIELAISIGYKNITRLAIANSLNINESLVSHYFGTMKELKTKILRVAIRKEILSIIAQGIVAEDPLALKAPEALKQRALQELM